MTERLLLSFELLVLIIAIGLLGFGLHGIGDTWLKVREAAGWPTVQGTILNRDWRSEMSYGRTSSSAVFIPQIRYRYAVDGKSYVSESVYPATPERWQSLEELRAYLAAEFPARGAVRVSYDPASPSRAAIILRGSYWTSATLAICGLVALGGWWAVRMLRRDHEARPAA